MRPIKLVSTLVSATLLFSFAVSAPASATTAPSTPQLSTRTQVPLTGNVLLAWEPVIGAARYRVEVHTAPNGGGTLVYSTDTTALQATPTSLLNAIDTPATVYYWRVGAIYGSEANPTNWSDSFSFERNSTVKSTGTFRPTGTVNYPTTDLRFEWPSVVGAKGYKLEYATNPGLSGATIARTSANSFTPIEPINRLIENTPLTYYWRVSPLDGVTTTSKLIADASPIKEFSVAWPNSRPTLVSPVDGSYMNDLRFEWSTVPGAKSYSIALRESVNGEVKHQATVPGTSYTPSDFLHLGTFFWSVTPFDANGQAGQVSASGSVTHDWRPNPEAYADTSLPVPAPAIAESGTGIDWTQPNSAGQPIEVTFADLQMAWSPVTRAGYYQVEVSTKIDPASLFTSYPADNKLTCLTPNTEVSPSFNIKKVTGTNAKPDNFQGLSANCLVANQIPTDTKNMAVGGTYAWRVRGFDSIAYSAEPKLNSADFPKTEWSRNVYFKIVPGASTSGITKQNVATEAPSVVPQTPHITNTAPLLQWKDTGAEAYRVVVRLASMQGNTEVVEAMTFGATSLRLNGILSDVTVGEPYRWSVASCTWVSPSWSCDSIPSDTENQETASERAALRFTKQGLKLKFLNDSGTATIVADPNNPISVSADDFEVSWQQYWSAGQESASPLPKYSGAAGYYVQITPLDRPHEIALSEKIEHNSWQYGRKTARLTTFQPLEYNQNYVLKVAPLDGYGNVGTLNDGMAFRFQEPAQTSGTATVTANAVVFSWDNIDAANKFRVVYRPTNGGISTKVDGPDRTKPSLPQRSTVIEMPAEGDYKWWLQTTDRNGNVSSEVEQPTFTVIRDSNAPVLRTPNNAVLSPTDRLLEWTDVPGASSYEVFVAKNSSAFATVGVKTTATSYAPNGTSEKFSSASNLTYANGAYKWRVRALNASGKIIAQSADQNFSVVSSPIKPTLSSAKVDGLSILLGWNSITGGDQGANSPVSFTVESRPVTFPESDWAPLATASPGTTSLLVNDLVKNTAYEFRINAVNAYGASEWSALKKATVLDVPASPVLRAPTAKKDSLTVTWVQASGARSTGYIVKYRVSGTTAWTTKESTSTTYTITGLKPGVSYDIEVRGKNASGLGSAALVSVKTLTLPGRSAAPTVKAGDKIASLSWKAPSAGSKPITRYTIERRSYTAKTKKWSAWTVAGTSPQTSFVARGLANGTRYEFRIAATSLAGAGSSSAAKAVTPAGKPIAGRVKATSTKRKQIKVTWSGTKSNGAAITKHVVQVSTNNKKWKTVKTAKASSKSYTWKKASAGKRYYVRVVTYNKLGKATSTLATVSVKK